MSNHPVHMMGKNYSLMPSSFIPFCSFGTHLSLLSSLGTNMTFPVCNMFKPTIYNGQLCYRLDISKTTLKSRAVFQGKSSGVMFILDLNKEKSVENLDENEENWSNQSKEFLNLDGVQNDLKNPAKIHIGTLAHFIGSGPGDYIMTSLKQITGTDSFLAKTDTEKKCTVETFEECQMRQAEKKNFACKCKPFELSSAFPIDQVLIKYRHYFQIRLVHINLDFISLSPDPVHACWSVLPPLFSSHPLPRGL